MKENADEAQRGRAQFRFGEKCVASLAPSQLVQFNQMCFYTLPEVVGMVQIQPNEIGLRNLSSQLRLAVFSNCISTG